MRTRLLVLTVVVLCMVMLGGVAQAATLTDPVAPYVETADCYACHVGPAHVIHVPQFDVACADCHTLRTPAIQPCSACHPDSALKTHGVSHSATDSAVEGVACSACHALALIAEHDKLSSSTAGSGCTACHAEPAASVKPWDGTCTSCHAVTSSAPMHANLTTVHAVADKNLGCLGCHSGTELGSIHADAKDDADGASSCLVCHKGDAAPSTGDCTVCHFTFDGHYGETRHTSSWTLIGCTGSDCHASRDLMTVHQEKNADFTCAGCHDDFAVASQIEQGLTGCGDCHDNIYQTSGHRAAHWASPLLKDAAGSHYSYYTGSAGSTPTSDCVMCHTSNLVDEHLGLNDAASGLPIYMPRFDSAGAALTCDSCHGSSDVRVAAAIAGSGLTACENCHDIHGPLPSVHTSTFVDNATLRCTDCHDADLVTEHSGLTSTADLTGCELCHSLYDGELGAAVQSAIAGANDTRCTACHSAYHENVTPHEATAPASLACGECHGAVTAGVLDVNSAHPDCTTCHAAASGRIDWSATTFECSSCHAAAGVDYHTSMSASHTYAAMPASCTSGGACHVANTLPEEHERFISRYGYTSTCSLCHKNSDPARIPAGATADCSSCHTAHGDIAIVHAATSSSACVSCHETADVRALHGTSADASCAVCHQAPAGRIDWGTATVECASCHGALSPVDPQHYPTVAHAAALDAGCSKCHSADLKAEHFKVSVSPSVTCVSCHEQRVDNFTTSWDRSCTACHASKHQNQAAAHKSSNTSCTGSGCHVVTDVSVLHGTTCEVCHGPGITPATDCTKCHTGANPHHATITLNMSTSSQWETVCGTCHGRVHSRGACLNCHSRDMHGESHHIEQNSNCAICHKVASADASDNCLGCHTDLSSSSGGSWGGGSWGGGSWSDGGTSTSGTVSGTITNGATGATVSGAMVSVAGKTATSGYSGTYSVTGVSAGTYTMTVTASGYDTWSGSVTVSSGSTVTKNVALSANAPALANLARTGTASANTTYGSTNPASRAIDGDATTYWRSGSGSTQWLRVDLGAGRTVSKVVLNWNSTYYAGTYRIDTSSDGYSWTTRYNCSSGNGGTDEMTFTAVSARYVRVYWSANYSSSYRISEFEVWGN